MFDVFNKITNRVDPDLAVGGDLAVGDYGTFITVVSMVLNVLMGIGFAISIVAIAFSAILYTMSGGDPEKTSRAWRAFINGVIAAAISIGAVAIKVIVLKAFGVETTGISILEEGSF